MSAKARHMLEEICQSMAREDLSVTFNHHASVEKMRKKKLFNLKSTAT